MAGEDEALGDSFARLLSIIPNIAAMISLTVLVLAFVHEWAYFSVLGGEYQSLLTITDYFNSAIGWLPWAAVGSCLGVLGILTDPMHHFSDKEKTAYYKIHKLSWAFERLPFQLIFWMGFLGGLFQFVFGDWYTRGLLELFFIFVWARVLKALSSNASIKNAVSKSRAAVYILCFGPMLFVAAYIGGMTDAAYGISPQREFNATGRLKKEYRERDWIVLRNLSSGLLLRDGDQRDKLRFYRWDDIAAYETQIVQPNRDGLICKITGYLCRERAGPK